MKKLIGVVLASFVLATSAVAQQLDTRGLTQAQVAELTAQAAKMRAPEAQAQSISAAVRNETAAWADLGANIGTAMVSAAREVGVAANEFSQTGLGKIVTGIVVYKVMGRDILGVIIGSAILLFGFGLVIWIMLTNKFGECKFEYQPVLWGLWQRRVLAEYSIDDDNANAKLICGLFVMIFTLAVGLACIF